MAASLTLFIIFSILVSASFAVRDIDTPLAEKDDQRPTFQARPLQLNANVMKEFYFHVYFHEIFYGPGQTTETVISVNSEYPKFADVLIFDVPLYDSLDEKAVIARAQGSAMQAYQKTYGWLLNYNVVFEMEQLKGSTLQVMGRALQLTNTREWSIVGGTGVFTMAKGVVYGRKLHHPDDNSLLVELQVHGYYTPMQQPPWN